ncbi:hypothetical protein BOX15_Mlig032804g6 [Macrostomum lignano]|uniref:Uncharacterized protein n=1 Tax=Macrostomum lignano TaxID=282301 RepID=A0A267DBC1_9PLAT|nr:hypothetical protein BOX15_Mlig032804g6 [Macrostomum lignano]
MHPVSAVASSAILTVSYLALLICSAVAGITADSTIDATRRSWDDGPGLSLRSADFDMTSGYPAIGKRQPLSALPTTTSTTTSTRLA